VGVGDGVSDSVGVGDGVSDSVGVGDGVSDSVGVGDGVPDPVGHGDGVCVGVGDLVELGFGFGEGAGSGGKPPTPKTGTVPVNPGGAESLDADWPERDEPDSGVPAAPGAVVEGDREGTPCEVPALSAPALATT
jgi:hypothetical protein